MRRNIAILSILFVLSLAGNVFAMTPGEATALFTQAGAAYHGGQYAQAANLYEQIRNGGWESGEVYYNLGNSYFRSGALGKAVLNYERARRFIPRDSDLLANTRYAFSLTKNFPQRLSQSPWQKFLDVVLTFATQAELLLSLLALGLILAVIHLWSLYGQWPKQRRVLACSILVVLFLSNFWIILSQARARKNLAVVIKDGDCKFEPREDVTTYFELYEGAKVRILKESGTWAKIERLDAKTGWIKRENIEKIF